MTDLNLNIGALHTDITLTLHTHHATKIWKGKQISLPDGTLSTRIISIPSCLKILNQIHQHSAQDNPYADAYLLKIEQQILSARKILSEKQEQLLDLYTDKLPEDIKLSQSFNINPVKIPLIIRSSIGYQLIYLLSDFDNLVRIALTASHIAILNRDETKNIIERTAHLLRSILGIIQRYQNANITRNELKSGSISAQAVLKRFGELPLEILERKQRSQFAPNTTNSKDESPKSAIEGE